MNKYNDEIAGSRNRGAQKLKRAKSGVGLDGVSGADVVSIDQSRENAKRTRLLGRKNLSSRAWNAVKQMGRKKKGR